MIEKDLFNRKFGLAIKRERQARRISQFDLGIHLGLHQSAIARIEQGTQSLNAHQVMLLLSLFNITFQYLLTDT